MKKDSKRSNISKALFVAGIGLMLFTPITCSAQVAPTSGDESLFSIIPSDESNYGFKTIEDGVNKYYNIDINMDNMSVLESLNFTEVDSMGSNTVEVNLPNGDTKYYEFSYL